MSPDVVARGTIPLANKARKGLLGGLGGSSGAVQDLRDGPTLSIRIERGNPLPKAMHVSIRGPLSLESPTPYNNNASPSIWRAVTAGFPCHVVAGDTSPTALDDE